METGLASRGLLLRLANTHAAIAEADRAAASDPGATDCERAALLASAAAHAREATRVIEQLWEKPP